MKHLILAAACAAIAGCATTGVDNSPPTAFRITSPQYPDNSMLAPQSAGNFAKNPNCTGNNVSPPLQWVNAPANTKSFALIWDDQPGRAGLGVSHALVYRTPANVSSFAENQPSAPTGKFVPDKGIFG